MLKKTHSDSLCFRVVAGLLLLGLGAMAESVKVSGIGHGLYAKPDEKSRVSTLPEGTVLAVRETSRDGWIKVAPPPSAECWIYRESVKDGRISSSRGRIRTAPLQTAPEIGSLSRGAAVEVREEQPLQEAG
jgi:hypothetical protein